MSNNRCRLVRRIMKIRNEFVCNSSYSSFVLDKEGMTKEQIVEFLNVVYAAGGEDRDTCIRETEKHFLGKISIHKRTIAEFLKQNNLVAEYWS